MRSARLTLDASALGRIVRCDTVRAVRTVLTKLTQASDIETPTRTDLARSIASGSAAADRAAPGVLGESRKRARPIHRGTSFKSDLVQRSPRKPYDDSIVVDSIAPMTLAASRTIGLSRISERDDRLKMDGTASAPRWRGS